MLKAFFWNQFTCELEKIVLTVVPYFFEINSVKSLAQLRQQKTIAESVQNLLHW